LTVPREPTASTPEQAARSDALRDQSGLLAATSQKGAPPEPAAGAPTSERLALSEALREEYGVLSAMLASVWSASLFRVSLLLGVVSAIGVALGFAAQASGGLGSTFKVFAFVALPLALFLGLATFARTVELQREAFVYITGMNRIRHAIADAVPASRPYFVLSIYDDVLGVYRSQGTGIRLHPPRFRLVFALSQTQGIVAVICAALAGIIGWIATATVDSAVTWAVAGAAFVAVLAALVVYWNRSIARLQAAIRPMFPTPPDAINAPI
jgi:hypothetical protein